MQKLIRRVIVIPKETHSVSKITHEGWRPLDLAGSKGVTSMNYSYYDIDREKITPARNLLIRTITHVRSLLMAESVEGKPMFCADGSVDEDYAEEYWNNENAWTLFGYICNLGESDPFTSWGARANAWYAMKAVLDKAPDEELDAVWQVFWESGDLEERYGDEEYEYDRYGDEPKECPAVITDDLYDMVFELVKGKACNEEDIPDAFSSLCG